MIKNTVLQTETENDEQGERKLRLKKYGFCSGSSRLLKKNEKVYKSPRPFASRINGSPKWRKTSPGRMEANTSSYITSTSSSRLQVVVVGMPRGHNSLGDTEDIEKDKRF